MINRLLKLIMITTISCTLSVITSDTNAQLDLDQALSQIILGVEIHDLDWNPDGNSLSAATDEGLRIYSADLQTITTLHLSNIVYSSSWHPDGNKIALTNGTTIEIWNWDGINLSFERVIHNSDAQLRIEWGPDKTTLAAISGSGQETDWILSIRFWNTLNGQLISTSDREYISNPTLYIPPSHVLAWNPVNTDELVFVGSSLSVDNGQYSFEDVRSLHFLNANTGQRERIIRRGEETLREALWIYSGDKIILTDQGGIGQIDLDTEEYFPGVVTGSGFNLSLDPRAIALTENGRYISADDFVYDLQANIYLGGFYRPVGTWIRATDWHPDNRRLATGNTNGTIRVEDVVLLSGFEQAPIANAGPDIVITDTNRDDNEAVILDGSASYDSDGAIINYSWEKDGISLATGSTPTIVLATGIHIINLTVIDNEAQPDFDSVQVIVNIPPTASGFGSGEGASTQSLPGGGAATSNIWGFGCPPDCGDGFGQNVQITLDATASSDPDGTITNYKWEKGSTVIYDGPNPAATTSERVCGTQSFTYTLTVTDNHGAEDTRTVGAAASGAC